MRRVLLFGATGTIGRSAARALKRGGYVVIAATRGAAPVPGAEETVDAANPSEAMAGRDVDAVISCMASRSGAPVDAWAVDHQAHSAILNAAVEAGVSCFVQLSAICVQKPRLAFQHAKLAFEAELMQAPITWSIVRPTAYFKSLSGQVARIRAGKPYLLFGDGRLTACKPISDDDLANYLVSCLTDSAKANRVLPIGGPGPALTPIEMGEKLFELTGQTARFRRVSPKILSAASLALGLAGGFSSRLAAKAELAKIGRYYATESMLVWDEGAGRYDAEATPETGSDTLFEHYARLIRDGETVDLGAHAVF